MMTMRDWVMPILIGTMGMAALFTISLAPSSDQSELAVFVAPWGGQTGELRDIAATGASFVRQGGLPGVWIVHAPAGSAARDAISAIALVVMDARFLGSCLIGSEQKG